MSFLFLLIGVLLHRIVPIFCANEINCSIINNLPAEPHERPSIENGTLTINFERDELAVFNYSQTISVNLLIQDVHTTFEGTILSKSNDFNTIQPQVKTLIEGRANLTENQTLTECDLKIKTNSSANLNISTALQDQLFYLAKSCIEVKLCEQLGEIGQDDYMRSETIKPYPYDFGEKSVLYNQLSEKLYNIKLPKKHNGVSTTLSSPDALKSTINFLVDFIVAVIIGQLSQLSQNEYGFIKVPNVSQEIPLTWLNTGTLELNNGILGNLKTISRIGDVNITNEGLHFTVELALKLEKVDMKFNQYKFYYLLVNIEGTAFITTDDVILGIKIDINYNVKPCRISADYAITKIDDVHVDLSKESFLDTIINTVAESIAKDYVMPIIDSLKLEVKKVIDPALERLSCEKYRP